MDSLVFDNTANNIPVTINGLNGEAKNFFIRELLGDEAEGFIQNLARRSTIDKGSGKVTAFNSVGIQLDLLELVLIDDSGNRVNRNDLKGVKSKILEGIYDAACKLNQLGEYSPDSKKGDKEKNG